MTEIVSVRLADDLAAALRRTAERQGKTVSDVLKDAIERAVERDCVCHAVAPATITGGGFGQPTGGAPISFTCRGCGGHLPATLHLVQ
jgi:hypothetical protein